MADPENVARGHKANLSNPRTSEESKERSKQVLGELGSGADVEETTPARVSRNPASEGKDPANVARGLKAAISNPHVSEEAKERDAERLRELED
ncbi:hypothetical protein ID866_618 [Astraeus odoratus]|nr:hypothetical protein ID866_618 [Astraeus odoratus]